MLSYINLLLIIVLTVSLIVGFLYVKNEYEKEVEKQDTRLKKIFNQINKNDLHLKDIDIKNKEEVQELITKNSTDLGENRGLISDNLALVGSVLNALNPTTDEVVEGYQELTAEEIKKKQEEALLNIAGITSLSEIKNKIDFNELTDEQILLLRGEKGEQGDKGEKGEDGTIVFDELTDEQIARLKGPKGDTGEQGPAGPAGPVGEQGPAGLIGPAGEQGPAGADGTLNFNELTEDQIARLKGSDGSPGPQGPVGPVGLVGPAGSPGPVGPAGADGTLNFSDLTDDQRDELRGVQGPTGPAGPVGPAGATGSVGPVGPAGSIGGVGPQGPTGATGPQGLQGEQGLSGVDGTVSFDELTSGQRNQIRGEQGPRGFQGTRGFVGPQGEPGRPGPQGLRGIQGPEGPPGTSSGSNNNVISPFTLLNPLESKKCSSDDNNDNVFLITENNKNLEECKEQCADNSDCSHISHHPATQDEPTVACRLYDECTLRRDTSMTWSTYKKNTGDTFVNNQKGYSTLTEAFFQPLPVKC